MSEFIPRSRLQKNDATTPSFSLDKLDRPQNEQSVKFVNPKVGHILAEKTGEPNLDRLRALYLAGRLNGMTLELPRFCTQNLECYLDRFYRHTLSENDRERLEEIAAFVCRLPFLEVN